MNDDDYTLRVVTAPVAEPVTLAETRDYCSIDSDDTSLDALLTALIIMAREYAENLTRRAFVQRTYELGLQNFPCDSVIELPRPPLRSVTSITYTDLNSVVQAISASTYQVDAASEPGRIKPVYLQYWPPNRLGYDFNAIKVQYVAGYPDSSPADYGVGNVPGSVKTWMKQRIAQYLANREPTAPGVIITEFSRSMIDGLLDPFVVDVF